MLLWPLPLLLQLQLRVLPKLLQLPDAVVTTTTNTTTVFIRNNTPGAMHFSKGGGGGGGGATITYTKTQLSSPVAIGDNGHLQPWSHLPACIMAGELKISETNLKSEEIIKFYLAFLLFSMRLSLKLPCFVLIFFISHKRYSTGEVPKRIFFRYPGIAKVLAVERDVKPWNMNFSSYRGGVGLRLIGRGVILPIYNVLLLSPLLLLLLQLLLPIYHVLLLSPLLLLLLLLLLHIYNVLLLSPLLILLLLLLILLQLFPHCF